MKGIIKTKWKHIKKKEETSNNTIVSLNVGKLLTKENQNL